MHAERNITALAALALVACAGCVASPEEGERAGQGLVSGNDDRKEVYAHESAWMRSYAEQATVALINEGFFYTVNGREYFANNGFPLTVAEHVCPSEPFADQIAAANCSGTLIDDDLVLTAGHCMAPEGDPTGAATCASTRFVFNDYYAMPGVRQTITPDDIFRCQHIDVLHAGDSNAGEADYAIVRLDRSAAPRFQPAPVRRTTAALDRGQHVKVVGFPSGIPAKIDMEGNVNDDVCRWTDGSLVYCASAPTAPRVNYFLASLDVFGGDSGAGVYEGDGYTLAGVQIGSQILPPLTRDTIDYSPATDGRTCNVRSVCSAPNCATALSFYAGVAIDDLCAVPSRSARLCGTGAPPNDRCDAATEIKPEYATGQQRTFAGSTAQAAHDITPPCSTSSRNAPDVFYRFTLGERSVFYADAFTSGFPVVLHLRNGCGAAATNLQCSATACSAESGQLAIVLDAGTYYLELTGRGTTSGRYNLHVQFLPASARSDWLVAPVGTNPPRPLTAARSGRLTGFIPPAPPASHASGTCGGAGNDDTYLFTTCPDFRGGTLRAAAALVPMPGAVYHTKQGNSLLPSCNPNPVPGVAPPLFELMPGSGVRALYIDTDAGLGGPYFTDYRFAPR